MRELTNKIYKTYFIEADEHVDVYMELAKFVASKPGCLVESLAPGVYAEGEDITYTLMVTVAQ